MGFERAWGQTPFELRGTSAERGLTPWSPAPLSPREIAYPVAVAFAAAGHGIALDALLETYAVAFVGNLASAAIRLSVIGQTDAQRLQADLMSTVDATAAMAAISTLADLGSATWSADLCSMEHETQYTRLFRS